MNVNVVLSINYLCFNFTEKIIAESFIIKNERVEIHKNIFKKFLVNLQILCKKI